MGSAFSIIGRQHHVKSAVQRCCPPAVPCLNAKVDMSIFAPKGKISSSSFPLFSVTLKDLWLCKKSLMGLGLWYCISDIERHICCHVCCIEQFRQGTAGGQHLHRALHVMLLGDNGEGWAHSNASICPKFEGISLRVCLKIQMFLRLLVLCLWKCLWYGACAYGSACGMELLAP